MVKDDFTKVTLSFHFMAFGHLEHSTIRKETNIYLVVTKVCILRESISLNGALLESIKRTQ